MGNFSYNFKDFYKYDIVKDSWSAVPSIYPGLGVEACTSFSYNNGLYVGLGKVDASSFAKDFYYYTASTGWSSLPTFPGNSRYNANCFVIGNNAYVSGGCDATVMYQDAYKFDLSLATWSAIATMPVQLYKNFSFTVASWGFIGGGSPSISDTATTLYPIYAYKPISALGTWQNIATYPGTARRDAYAIGGLTKGYIFGGEYYTSQTNRLNDVLIYTPSTNTWATGANIPGDGRAGIRGAGLYANTIEYYTYFTAPSTSSFPNNCNLMAYKTDNFARSYAPTLMGTIPILTGTYWQKPQNSFYPNDIAANPTYVLVSQWRWCGSYGDVPSGTNALHIGYRKSNGNIASWMTQIIYRSDNIEPGLTITIDKEYPEKIYVKTIYEKLYHSATITGSGLYINTNNLINVGLSTASSMYANFATYAPKDSNANKSVVVPLNDGRSVYIRPNEYLYGLSKQNSADVTYITASGASSDLGYNPYIYWKDR